jgi:hypothetical protein
MEKQNQGIDEELAQLNSFEKLLIWHKVKMEAEGVVDRQLG